MTKRLVPGLWPVASSSDNGLDEGVDPVTGLDVDGLAERRHATRSELHTGCVVALGAGQQLGLDRRTVKTKIDPEYLARLEADHG